VKPTAKKSALLEIGTEEIPARFIPEAEKQLQSILSEGLAEKGIEFGQLQVWGTPRRLTAYLTGAAAKSKDRVDVVIGPPLKAAKDAQGQWTAAATGFAKTQGVSVEKLLLETTAKGERFVVKKAVKGQALDALLKDLFPSAIQRLSFPKTMVWEESGFRFARPLRWILALVNSQVIRFSVASVRSDRATMGLLALGGSKISVPTADRYRSILQGRCVLVDPEQRRKNIKSQMETLAKKLNATPVATTELLDEVVNLTEYPVALLASFKGEFLTLPKEVLISSLVKHQKFFPLEAKGILLNHFIGVRNGPSESQETVREGYERVVAARLSDARFFYDQDSKLKLRDLAARLNEIAFIEKAGTLADKAVRVERLTVELGNLAGSNAAVLKVAQEAAQLSKADLLTQIVGEFPELQGVAGRFYGETQEEKSVAAAIEQHYWPLSAEGTLPKTEEAALISVADKMDTLACYFAAGQIPSGSADPFGLRRQGIGIIRILLDRKWNLPLSQLVGRACQGIPFSPDLKAKAAKDLAEFLNQRCFHWLANQGFRSDELDAVLSQNGQSIAQLREKLEGLKAVRGRPEFASLAAAIKRARNILRQAGEKGVLPKDTSLTESELESDSERTLVRSLAEARPQIEVALRNGQFKDAFLALAPLKKPVDAFFEGVMVMVDDEQRRSQRLTILLSVRDLFDSVADFSKLQIAV
jgi:glycyl-tRNA synthetase beta chain